LVARPNTRLKAAAEEAIVRRAKLKAQERGANIEHALASLLCKNPKRIRDVMLETGPAKEFVNIICNVSRLTSRELIQHIEATIRALPEGTYYTGRLDKDNGEPVKDLFRVKLTTLGKGQVLQTLPVQDPLGVFYRDLNTGLFMEFLNEVCEVSVEKSSR